MKAKPAYKSKLPSFPPKYIKRLSPEIIAERKGSLAKYMNILSQSVNIFEDLDIVKFLKLDFESAKVRTLKQQLEENLLLMDKLSSSNDNKSSPTMLQKKLSSPEFILPKFFMRSRIHSHDDNPKEYTKILANLPQRWADLTFENEDERVSKFIEYLHNDPENLSSLISEFEEWYFGKKPILQIDNLKRLFHGQMKREGLLHHL